jgi:outer membrane protein OmpA-like peptidoglycan-associated protein
LKEFPDLEIRIESHTDSRGSDEYNMLLSKKRARAAFDYVVSKGIDPMRLLYQGYGETRLLNKCGNGVECTEEQHEVNRRSIVKVVRKGTYQEKRGQKNIQYF